MLLPQAARGRKPRIVTAQVPCIINLVDLLREDEEYAAEREAARERGEAPGPALPSFPKLAEELCDALPVGVTVLHGAPGAGKTAFAFQLAAEAGCPALYVTIEMSPRELLWRQAARVTSTYISKFRRASLGLEARKRFLREGVKAAPHLSLIDATQSRLTEELLASYVATVKGDAKHCLLVIDSVSSWVRSRVAATGETEYQAISAVLEWLRGFAGANKIAIVAIAEQNRAQRDTTQQSAAAGSRGWEYLAETMFALNRDSDADDEENIAVSLTLAKNRIGAQGRCIEMVFESGFMRFSEASTAAIQSRREREKETAPAKRSKRGLRAA